MVGRLQRPGLRRLGYVAIVLSAFAYGSSWVFVKWLYSFDLDPLQLLANRYLFATPVIWIVLWLVQRRRIQVSRRALVWLIALGVLNAGTEGMLAYSLVFLDASLVSVLFYTFPVMVSGMAVVVFSEQLNRFRALALILIVTGTMMVAQLNPFGALQISGLGIALALAGALACALFTLRTQSLGPICGPLEMSTLTVTFAAAALVMVRPPVYLFDGSVSPEVWPPIVALSVFCTAASLSFYVIGISLVGASNGSIAATLEPVVAVVTAFIILGERLDPLQVMGVVSILAAVTLLQFQREPAARAVGGGPPAAPVVADPQER